MENLDMCSKDIISNKIIAFEKLFPNCVVNGKIDFDSLKQELSEILIDEKKEKYQLTWPGKKESIVNSNTPTTKTLRPIKEKSLDFENTKNKNIKAYNEFLSIYEDNSKVRESDEIFKVSRQLEIINDELFLALRVFSQTMQTPRDIRFSEDNIKNNRHITLRHPLATAYKV